MPRRLHPGELLCTSSAMRASDVFEAISQATAEDSFRPATKTRLCVCVRV